MTLRSPLAAILLVATAAGGAVPAAAQSEATTGIIRGIVRGPSGAPVEGALVLIQHGETGFVTSVETTASGNFARTLLPLGSYELIVTKDDRGQMERIAGLTLRVGETLNLDLALKGVVAEEITVSEDANQTPATDDVTTSQRLADEVIEGLPTNGRNFFDLTLLTPGASLSQGPDGDELTSAASAASSTTSSSTAPTSTTPSSASSAAASDRPSPSTRTRSRRWWSSTRARPPSSAARPAASST